MFGKALFINFRERELPESYFLRLQPLFEKIEYIQRDDPKLKESLIDTEVMFTKFGVLIDKEIIDTAPKLKYIGKLATAYDDIDVKYAREKGITVCNLGGYSTEAVAEFAIATIWERARELERAKNQARKEDFGFTDFMGIELKDKTLGVIGAGKIGGRIAEIGLGIGMKVNYFSRENKNEIEAKGGVKKELDEVISESDFVAVALVLNKETENVINKDKIALFKENAIVVNIAPPVLIDQEAILERTEKGNLTFIFDHSDDISLELAKRFLANEHCIVYPPVAFRSKEADINKWETFTSNMENFVKGNPQNVVD
jgi:glycerate dehydrogenase